MKLPIFLLTFLLIFINAFLWSFALRCYHCDSRKVGKECPEEGSETNSKYITACKGSCYIKSYWAWGHVNIRKCIPEVGLNHCSRGWMGLPCYCSTDLCNRET